VRRAGYESCRTRWGYATRLWPITETRPKMFLPVGENTVIDEIFEDFEADDRIDEVFVSTNERFADAFADYLTDSPFKKPHLLGRGDRRGRREVRRRRGARPAGRARERRRRSSPSSPATNMISFDPSDFADFFESKGTLTLAAYDVGTASAPSPTGSSIRRRRGHRLPGEARRPEDDARLHRVLRVPRGDAARPLDVP